MCQTSNLEKRVRITQPAPNSQVSERRGTALQKLVHQFKSDLDFKNCP